MEATGWLKMRVPPNGIGPALARLTRFDATAQVYFLRKDLLELTHKTSSGPGKCADAKTVNRVLDLAGRAENRGNLGIAIPCTHLFFQKSGRVGLWPPAPLPARRASRPEGRAYASERYWGSIRLKK